MEKSPCPGKTSSPKEAEASACRESAIKRLEALASSEPAKTLSKALSDPELCLVGGAVRDAISGRAITDFDFAAKLRPEEAKDRLSNAGIRTIDTGLEHGTITALIGEDSIEITTFREPGLRTGAGFSDTIERDLSGRDFTINAIAFRLRDFALIDPFNGADDLGRNLLRAVNDPAIRLGEDPLRVMRMIRFGPAAGRILDPNLESAAASIASRLKEISPERIKAELEHIVLSSHPREAFRTMLKLGILDVILPEMLPSVGFAQNEFHTEDVFEHTLSVIDRAAPERLVRLAALFHDLGKPASFSVGEDGRRHFYKHEILGEDIARAVMERLRFSVDDSRKVARLVKQHMRPLDCGPAGVRRIIRDLESDFEIWRLLKIADSPPVMADQEFAKILDAFDELVRAEQSRKKGSIYDGLAVDGADLKTIGFVEGKELGLALKALWELVLDDPNLNEKSVLMAKAREILAK